MSLVASVSDPKRALEDLLSQYQLQGLWRVYHCSGLEPSSDATKLLTLAWKALAHARVTQSQPIFAVAGQTAQAAIRKSRRKLDGLQLALVKEPAILKREMAALKSSLHALEKRRKRIAADLEKRLQRTELAAAKKEKALAGRAEKIAHRLTGQLKKITLEVDAERRTLREIKAAVEDLLDMRHELKREVARLESHATRLEERVLEERRFRPDAVLDDPDADEDEAAADEADRADYDYRLEVLDEMYPEN